MASISKCYKVLHLFVYIKCMYALSADSTYSGSSVSASHACLLHSVVHISLVVLCVHVRIVPYYVLCILLSWPV